MRGSSTPIQRTLMTVLLLTSGAVMLTTSAAFCAYDFFTFRQQTLHNLATLGEAIAANSTAALAFENQDDAREVLSALKAERHIVEATLFTRDGARFASYPGGGADYVVERLNSGMVIALKAATSSVCSRSCRASAAWERCI